MHMNYRLVEEQIRLNRITRDGWSRYSSHREHLTRLLTKKDFPGGRLLVLGAGNCNDLDLQGLLRSFSELHLVDIDAEALDWGVNEQGLSGNEQIVLHGGLDVTGIAALCSR